MSIAPLVDAAEARRILERTQAEETLAKRNVANVAYNYLSTVSGAKDGLFGAIKTACSLAHFNGYESRISSNVENLASDAGSYLGFIEIYTKAYDAYDRVANVASQILKWEFPEFFSIGEMCGKVSRAAANVLNCAALLAKKGVAMWETSPLKLMASRFGMIQFGWGMVDDVEKISRPAAMDQTTGQAVPETERDAKKKTHAWINLAFNTSIFTLQSFAAFGAALSPVTALFCSSVATASTIGGKFYKELNGLDLKALDR